MIKMYTCREICKYCLILLFISIIAIFPTAGASPTAGAFPEYSQEAFEALKNDSHVIDTRGVLPDIEKKEDKKIWADSIGNYSQNIVPLIDPYLGKNGGPILMYAGEDIGGYSVVGFNETLSGTIDESTIDEIYKIIADEYERNGISNVPVVFTLEREILDDTEEILDEDTGSNASSETNQTPGFTVILLIMGLLLAFKINRK